MDENDAPKQRSKCRITADILFAIQKEGQAKITYLIHDANLPYSRIMEYLNKMERTGLIKVAKSDTETWYEINDKGQRYLVEFKKFTEFGDIFGVEI